MHIVNVGKALIRRKSDGKYLILRSSKWEERPDRSQKPDLPGGGVEEKETIAQGCVREIQEETGITVDPSLLTLVYTMTFQSGKDNASINRLIYYVEIDDPNITLSWEHEEFWWMSADEIVELDIREPYASIFGYLHEVGVLV